MLNDKISRMRKDTELQKMLAQVKAIEVSAMDAYFANPTPEAESFWGRCMDDYDFSVEYAISQGLSRRDAIPFI